MKSRKSKSSHPKIKSTHSDPIEPVRSYASSSKMIQSKLKGASFPKTTMASEATSQKNPSIFRALRGKE